MNERLIAYVLGVEKVKKALLDFFVYVFRAGKLKAPNDCIRLASSFLCF